MFHWIHLLKPLYNNYLILPSNAPHPIIYHFRMSKETSFESDYLKEHLMKFLPGLLAEVSTIRPKDPIAYIAEQLRDIASKK